VSASAVLTVRINLKPLEFVSTIYYQKLKQKKMNIMLSIMYLSCCYNTKSCVFPVLSVCVVVVVRVTTGGISTSLPRVP